MVGQGLPHLFHRCGTSLPTCAAYALAQTSCALLQARGAQRRALLCAGAQDCPGARGTWYPSTLAFQSTPNRPQASLNAVVTGILSASDCHALGHDMAAAALAGLHANQLTRITTLQDPETALLPTKASVYYGVTQNGKCEIHTLVPGEADLTRGASPFMGFSTCVHA